MQGVVRIVTLPSLSLPFLFVVQQQQKEPKAGSNGGTKEFPCQVLGDEIDRAVFEGMVGCRAVNLIQWWVRSRAANGGASTHGFSRLLGYMVHQGFPGRPRLPSSHVQGGYDNIRRCLDSSDLKRGNLILPASSPLDHGRHLKNRYKVR